MKRKLLTLLALVFCLSGCGENSSSTDPTPTPDYKDEKPKKEDKEDNKEEEKEETEEQKEEVEKIEIVDGYLFFGNYPQREIVSKETDSGTYGKSWFTSDDYIVDENLFSVLENLSENMWDENGDTIIENNKYRRIKSSDAIDSADEANNYNWSSLDGYHYFKYEKIKWRVLENNNNEVFVMSEVALDDQKYNTKITNMTWETSTIRSWLNGYDSNSNLYGTDYSSNNFLDTAFTESEQEQIKVSNIINNDNSYSGTEGGNDTSDKIFLLSEEEVYGETATKYGFSLEYNTHDEARQAKSSTYAKAMGVYSDCETDYLGNCFWWLRSPGSYTGLFILVRNNGSVYRGGQHADSKSRGVRPAMRINFN